MNDWTKERFKKELETKDLVLFCDAYESAIGERLEIIEVCERPDFVCQRDNGTIIGVELTRVIRDPESALWDEISNRTKHMSMEHAIERVQAIVEQKDIKRMSGNWKYHNNTILVIQLYDISIYEIEPFLTPQNMPDLYNLGFTEIWLGDYTEIDAFGDIELFCVTPEVLKGYYRRGFRKPFG